MPAIAAGLLGGVSLTSAFAWFARGRLLNFDCPPGTTDYCSWNLAFVAKTFGPMFLGSALATTLVVVALRRVRDRRG